MLKFVENYDKIYGTYYAAMPFTRAVKEIKHIFVINPKAGKGVESNGLECAISNVCAAAEADYEIYYTKARADATRYVCDTIKKKPEGETYRFYACGGDGTLSEVVSGAVGENEHLGCNPIPGVEVGCVPIGTGNDFVRNFYNSQFFSDISKQIAADSTVIDCYRFDEGRYGVNMINIGFDCEVAARAAELKQNKFIPKKLAYIAGIVSVLGKNRGLHARVIFGDGREEKREFQLVSAANGGFCGGGFHSAPESILNDGKLDVSLIDKVTRRDFIGLVGAYKNGMHLGTRLGRKVVHYTKEDTVTFLFDGPTNVCIDGEIEKRDSLTLAVVPNSLAFVIPVGCKIK